MYPDKEKIAGIIENKKFKRRVRTDFKSPYFFYGMFGTDDGALMNEYLKLEEDRQFYEVFWQGMGMLTAWSGAMTLLLAVLTGGVPEKILAIIFACSAVLTVVLVMIHRQRCNIVNAKLFRFESEIARDYRLREAEEEKDNG